MSEEVKTIQYLDEQICKCPKCRGTLSRALMCLRCLKYDRMISKILKQKKEGENNER